MSEFVRSVVAQLQKLMGKTNSPVSLPGRLPLNVSPAIHRAKSTGELNPGAGYTCELGRTELTFTVPSIVSGGRHLFCDSEPQVELQIHLPSVSVDMKVLLVRYDAMSGDESGYLVGARIVDMSEIDRARYYDFLRTTGQELRRTVRGTNARPARAST